MAETRQRRRIIFTGDIFRPAANRFWPAQTAEILWLWRLLRRQIELATGIAPGVVAWPTDLTLRSGLAPETVPAFLDLMGVPRSIEGWAVAQDATALPDIVEGYLGALFEAAIVIGFELPPVLRRLLDRAGVPFLDLMVHPARFLDDLTFALGTNCAEMRAIAARHCLSADFLMTMAGLQSAAAGHGFEPDFPRGALLFLGQRRHDRTLVRDGRFRDARDFVTELRALAARHSMLLLKPHPQEPDEPGLLALELGFPASRLVTDNVYKLLSSDHLAATVSLSSSAGLEAQFFGKESCHLVRSPCRLVSLGESSLGSYLDLDWSMLAPDFWRAVLAPHLSCSPPDGMIIPFKPNRLRISRNAFGRFNEIDTDVAIAAYRRES